MVTLYFFLSRPLAALASPDAQVGQGKQGELVVQEKADGQVALAGPA